MHQDIYLSEVAGGFLHHRSDVLILGHIAWLNPVSAERLGQRAHAALQLLGGVTKAQNCPLAVKRLGDPPSDAVVVGHAEDQRGLAGE